MAHVGKEPHSSWLWLPKVLGPTTRSDDAIAVVADRSPASYRRIAGMPNEGAWANAADISLSFDLDHVGVMIGQPMSFDGRFKALHPGDIPV